MKETRNCLESKMTLRKGASNVWEYTKQPEGEPRWNTESIYFENNCIVEEITLHRECNDCPIIAPYGSLGKPSKAFPVDQNTSDWTSCLCLNDVSLMFC